MDKLEKQEQYEEHIARVNPAAMVVGRRVPYHLEYLRRHGAIGPAKEDRALGQGKEGRMET